MTHAPIEVGIIVALYRFPVKSMAGELLQAAPVGWNGLVGDRRYAFVQADNRTHFPWLTARQVPRMLRYVPRLADLAQPARSPVFVQTPDGSEHPIDSDQLRAELAAQHNGPISLIQIGHGTQDCGPGISLMSRSSVRALAAEVGQELDERRFRQNIMIEAYEDTPFIEDSWINGTLTFGDRPDAVQLRLRKPIERCMMVNLSPESAQQEPRVLRSVVNLHDTCAGVDGSVAAIGTIRVGDVIRLSRML